MRGFFVFFNFRGPWKISGEKCGRVRNGHVKRCRVRVSRSPASLHPVPRAVIKERVKPNLSGWRSDSGLREMIRTSHSVSALGHISKAFENKPSGRLGGFLFLGSSYSAWLGRVKSERNLWQLHGTIRRLINWVTLDKTGHFCQLWVLSSIRLGFLQRPLQLWDYLL